MLLDLEKLIEKQAELDTIIFKKTKSSYKKNQKQRRLWLAVEIGNLAKQIEAYKFWKNGPKEDDHAILEACANVLHLSLSFLIQFKTEIDQDKKTELNFVFDVKQQKQKPSSLIASKRFLELYELCLSMEDWWSCQKFIDELLTLISLMRLNFNDLFKEYIRQSANILKRIDEDI
ncbi:dUTPase [Mycoplasmoides gallisepticum]|nr:dUTPase [Mycoplasmoides gallisepticum]AFP75944.1 putative dUTPase [Mycoplasmoides gallisepticum VA94_7994-1-7P]AFP76711.1 putative dUTPase [Mycoplasmoides gallisepticum NC95_13295-2-2P]AFP77465.1 putative dUTPase [Mycoplasmoides gallisepticum NC96_1596-4-2P]AFP78236.1 putative dUTPase [Mycoplasmoides gallisepticum NY01_2001.047-5-1P]AFP78996.1 putative dUTPase [Mycoplasmoides gallisepticum WI01_2001.043-13-2P]